VIEFRGPVVEGMSMEERMTLSNMAIEAGGTSGLCMPDAVTVDYLWPFVAGDYGNDKSRALSAFARWWSDDDAAYASTITVDVSTMEPVATVGYKPDQVKKVSELADIAVDQVYIGSCTNGRLSDLREAAAVLRGRRLAPGVRGILAPATPKVYRDALKEGIIDVFLEAGFCVTNPTCGACLGMSNGVLAEGEVCASTTNRNFNGRMGKGGMVHLMSPAGAAATAVAGRIADCREYV
jgi:3-isopropylmalate/(R)-2-methylmalate dehydratase large subunit